MENKKDLKNFTVDELYAELERRSMFSKDELRVFTPVGKLRVYPSQDVDYPGVYIDLQRPGHPYALPLAVVEHSHTEYPECQNPEVAEKGALICKAWGRALQEDFTDKTVFEGIDEMFGEE